MIKLEQAARHYMSVFGQALEAHGIPFSKDQLIADVALREALAEQADQEPVGTAGELFTMSALERLDVRPSTKVYLNAAPVRTKDLTDEEIVLLAKQTNGIYYDCDCVFARAVIAAYKDKNK